MLAYCTKALDTTLDGIEPEVSPPSEWTALSDASGVFLQARITGFVATLGARKIEFALETSAEGTDWTVLWEDVFIALTGQDNNAFFAVPDLAAARYLRCRAVFRPDYVDQSCRVEVWLTGRIKRERATRRSKVPYVGTPSAGNESVPPNVSGAEPC
jgi:hypothetical protein